MDTARPYMPGYGISEDDKGLLPWSWAEKKLISSPNYWVATVWPDGRPHLMPVWGVWDGEVLWFSSGLRSRKVRNLQADPRVTITIDDSNDPVVLYGRAEIVTEQAKLQAFIDASNAKYHTNYDVKFLDPSVNACVAVRPEWAFGLVQKEFGESPTRWTW